MNKILFNGLLLSLLLMISGCKMVEKNNIVNDNINAFFENRDFSIGELNQFKVNEAVILPYFNGQYLYDGKNTHKYTFIVSASSAKELDYIQIHSYQINISGELEKKNVSEELNKQYNFEKVKMDKKSEEYIYILSKYYKKEFMLKVDEKSQIEVILDISVKSSEKKVRKTIKVLYRYEKTKDAAFPT